MRCIEWFCLGLLLVCSLTSCQTEVEVDIPDYQNKLVVEGSIESNGCARVVISKSVPYFSKIDLNVLLKDVLVTDAVVSVIANDGTSEQLTFEYCEDSPVYFAYVGHKIKGEYGKDYTLKILYDNKEYSAHTSIPKAIEPDSLWFAFSTENVVDTTPTIRLLLTDDPTENNYYRFFVKVRHGERLTDRQWVATFPIVFDDQTFNGKTFNFELLRAQVSTLFTPTMSDEELVEYSRMTYRPGDTVLVKSSAIDYESYKFWVSAFSELSFGQNPFMNPSPIYCSIKGENVIGVWSGFASKIDTLIYEIESK